MMHRPRYSIMAFQSWKDASWNCMPRLVIPVHLVFFRDAAKLTGDIKRCHALINYMLNRWESFTRFLESGAVPMENNAAERVLKYYRSTSRIWLTSKVVDSFIPGRQAGRGDHVKFGQAIAHTSRLVRAT